MSPVPIDVDPEVFDAASKVFGQDLANGLDAVCSQLNGALQRCAAMAGSDPAGMAWAGKYDPAAQDVTATLIDLRNASITIAALLEQTGFNHGMAEAASDPTRSVPTPPDRTRYQLPADNGVCPTWAAGGSGGAPHGWGLVEHAVGYVWPNGDPGRLRDAGTAWSSAAGSLDALIGYVSEAESVIVTQTSPEIDDAFQVCSSMGTHIADTAASCRDLATACTGLADHIDQAHHDIEHELISLLEWTAGIELVGGIFGVLTGGAAEAPAQAVEAERIAATGSRIAEIITALISAARTVGETINAVVSRIGEVAGRLRTILGARLSLATTELVARLPEEERTAEELATVGLRTSADSATTDRALYQSYVERKAAQGKAPLSFDAWESRVATLRANKATGDAYRDQVATDLGITPGENGWQTEYTLPNSGRRFDIANPGQQRAIEVKSGTTPTDEGLAQLAKDEKAIRKGWAITWQLKVPLNDTLMARLQQLADEYPGLFNYTVAGR